eukprot:4683559-Amphidinium_carterae.1
MSCACGTCNSCSAHVIFVPIVTYLSWMRVAGSSMQDTHAVMRIGTHVSKVSGIMISDMQEPPAAQPHKEVEQT